MWRKLLVALAATLTLTTSACDTLVAPEAVASSRIAGASLFDAPHYPASTDLSLPRVYVEGEIFDPFCDGAPPFLATITDDGVVLSTISAVGPVRNHSAGCWAIFNACNKGCKRWPSRARPVCYGKCVLELGICQAAG